MSIMSLCRLAWPDLAAKFLAGDLSIRDAWTVAEGAEKYRKAIAEGDVCKEADALARASVCAGCPTRVDRASEKQPGTTRHYCGEPFEDRRETVLPSCGCLLGLTVNGVPVPGGKVLVASQACDQGKWGPCPRA